MNTTIKYIRKGLEVFLDCDSSKMLNDLGFNRKCKYAYYEPFAGIIRKTDIKWCGYVYDAPTIDVTERWLRENKNIHFDVKLKGKKRTNFFGNDYYNYMFFDIKPNFEKLQYIYY